VELEVGNEISIFDLLICEFFRIDVKSFKVCIKSGLARKLTHVEFFSPERMLPQMLPVNTLGRIFL
jgi:hypothetical protein